MRQIALILFCLLSSANSASSQIVPSCTASITSPMVFSGFDVLSGAAVDTTATLDISCSGLLSVVNVSVCPSIEAGSGGQVGGVRRMQRVSGTETLSFGLYQDASRTIPWGSLNDPSLGDPPLITVVVPILGTGNASATIYARILGGQTGLPPGTYLSDFSGTQTEIRYGLSISGTSCGGDISELDDITTAPFSVETTLDPNCLFNVLQNVDFGVSGILSANVDAAGQVEVTCTNGTGYNVSLQRQAGALPLGSWRMTKGGEHVTYALYSDASRTELWGDLPGDIVSGTGNGAGQALDVYGRVPPQTTPSAGVYTDTVVVTVTY